MYQFFNAMLVNGSISPRKRPQKRRVSISEHLDNIQKLPLVVTTAKNVDLDCLNDADKEESPAKRTTSNDEEKMFKKIENGISVLIIVLEHLLTSIVTLLPEPVIGAFTLMSRYLFSMFKSNNEVYNEFIKDGDHKGYELIKLQRLKNAKSFEQICAVHGFRSESHLVKTEDGFQLTLHRINPEDNGFEPNGKCVYFQHGLLMASDVWCVMLNKDDNIPFRLCELGYDVYLGNNRGNKYSCKHAHLLPSDKEFWNFSIDEFALYDIPANINYILDLKGVSSLIYVGFSQGTSQILSSISINHDLNEKISKLVLISPATTPKKLSNWLINSIVHFQPSWIYMLFGRKILMKSVLFWRQITYPPMFVKLIDLPNDVLFSWKSMNIDIAQKLVSYYHLYSTTSVKCVVHWFQIIRSKKFQMYQDSELFQPFEYPTRQAIKVKELLLIFGMNDSLVDIDIIMSQLPKFRTIEYTQLGAGGVVTKQSEIISEDAQRKLANERFRIYGIEGHEHLDLLWGRDEGAIVVSRVVEFLQNL